MFVLMAAATGYVCSERKVHQLTRTTPTGMEHKRPQCGAESGGVGFLMGMEKGEVVLVHNWSHGRGDNKCTSCLRNKREHKRPFIYAPCVCFLEKYTQEKLFCGLEPDIFHISKLLTWCTKAEHRPWQGDLLWVKSGSWVTSGTVCERVDCLKFALVQFCPSSAAVFQQNQCSPDPMGELVERFIGKKTGNFFTEYVS